MKKSAIIVAGGKGLRMGSDIPKQFIQIDAKPIIVRTIERFLECDPSIHLVVVIPMGQMKAWEEIERNFFSQISIVSAPGGASRFLSVQSGLSFVDEGLVAIHDAVRPYVSIETIQKSFASAKEYGSGVATVDLKDSIRKIEGEASKAQDRRQFKLVQTPQTFRVEEIKQAFNQAEHTNFQDDAAVYESTGGIVRLIDGTYANIKITTHEDLK